MKLDMSRGAARATVFLFCFTLVLFAANLIISARDVSHVRALTVTATRNAASIRQLCQAGNEARAQQIVLWDHLLSIAQPPPHQTPAQARHRLATERAFEAYVHHVFAPRDCRHPLNVTH